MLRAVTAFAQNNDLEKGFWLFVEKVQALSGGSVHIEYLGGPEAIPPFEQIEAVRSGVVDLSTNAGSYFSSAIPEGDAMKLSELTPWEERDNGAHAFFADVLAEHGVHYLGRYNTPGLHFNFYTKERVETLEDLRGLRMRISPLYKPFAEALGIVPVQLAHSEIYTALERGMVDGIGAANIGMSQQGHQKFLGFIVEPQFYGNDQVIIMNLEAWNDLPQAAQDAITQAIIETERESSEAFGAIASEERQTIVDEGLEVVMIPDAEQYLSLAREQGWADLVAKSPETGPQLREMLTRE
jgi:TRAP-type C4-dicarboxylate transport system substrate-binding protein